MITVMVNHKVENYDAWLPHFEAEADSRRKNGCKSVEVYRATDDPNNVTVLMKWSDGNAFDNFIRQNDLETSMQEAGVIGEPIIETLTPVGTYPS